MNSEKSNELLACNLPNLGQSLIRNRWQDERMKLSF